MRLKKLTDAAQVVEVLGGPQEVAEMTRAKNVKTVWNWHGYFEEFPPNTYKVMIDGLRRRGYTAPAYLWKMKGFEKPTNRAA